jgi:hypothetical protein
MKLKGWLVSALLASGVVFGFRAQGGCLAGKAPDEKLADRFEDLCDIARDNVETPERGVRKLGRYMGSHTDDILGELGGTVQLIERISDDEEHDARAYVARERIQKPLRSCAGDWNRFRDAVESDPAAAALVDRAIDRLGRTFEIIFSGSSVNLRSLPEQLEHAFDRR